MTENTFPNDDLIGVVLMGGKSSRMGMDKSLLEIDNQPLYKIAGKKLAFYCNQVFLSVNEKQPTENNYDYPYITDRYEGEGPIGAMLSCMDRIEGPILFLACDMPYISENDIKALINLKNKNNICSTYFHPQREMYEPLFSIWEPNSKTVLEPYFASGNRSLQRFLHQQNVPKINMPNPENFININHPDEWKMISSITNLDM